MTRVPPDWPFAHLSRAVRAGPHDWHVQEDGDGPLALLIHGAGGGTQSFRHLFPLLTTTHRVAMFDLPGQGFTRAGAQRRFGLDPMAEDIAALMDAEGWTPDVIIGHSAGAALALRLAEMGRCDRVVGINAAISNFSGVAGVLFPLMAKALAAMPFVADIFTANASRPGSVERLIAGTGSNLTAPDLDFYRRLVSTRGHVSGTLSMMAQWQLDGLLSRLPSVQADVLFVTGSDDKAVPPKVSAGMAAKMPNARHVPLEGLGHLAHEEDAVRVLATLRPFLWPTADDRSVADQPA
ncbi:alpha/beta fold hydrolase BchO [Jannaschia donghaensis]|uniref:2-hydroxymuconate semialdehyde hydrolase n=1 Tax=Jannaschia donghaensis TaxID=420998 RepID=A0A0M6YCH0_9RHOB|nr:alpha/beta fold hydrolase BchO [Jannaschia donghaensis]CTQ48048.1 2-hydroxymuconate semialdehyde hydrolase [Jannaschia donghaensis]